MYPVFNEDGVSICFNSTGTKVFSMYRYHAPVLHSLWESSALCYYGDLDGKYKNSVTMKSGCFMGQDDEVRSATSYRRQSRFSIHLGADAFQCTASIEVICPLLCIYAHGSTIVHKVIDG
jgi:hypothetical protein